MTTETTCLSSVWRTDSDTKAYLAEHGRESDYRELNPADVAYYDGCVEIDLSTIKPMIALPFHPSNAYTISDFYANMKDHSYGQNYKRRQINGTAGSNRRLCRRKLYERCRSCSCVERQIMRL